MTETNEDLSMAEELPAKIYFAAETPYDITQRVRDLDDDRRIVGFNAGYLPDGEIYGVLETTPDAFSRTLWTAAPEPDLGRPPYTKPYAPWDSWNPDK